MGCSCSESQDRILPENTWRIGRASQCTWWAITLQFKDVSKDAPKEMLVDEEVTWHQSCYSYATNQTELQQVRDHFEHLEATGLYAMKRRGHKWSSSEMEADATDPLLKVLCFFCQLDSMQALFSVRTLNSGKALRQAVEISKDPALMTRLSNVISRSDAHAIAVSSAKSVLSTAKNTNVPFLRKGGTYRPSNCSVFSQQHLL